MHFKASINLFNNHFVSSREKYQIYLSLLQEFSNYMYKLNVHIEVNLDEKKQIILTAYHGL